VSWLGSARRSVRDFRADARARAGYEVYRFQLGLDPTDWKPMTSIGDGVCEIRVRLGREYRLLYVARFPEAIYVLHAFEKKTRKTSRADLEVARLRYRQMIFQRTRQGR